MRVKRKRVDVNLWKNWTACWTMPAKLPLSEPDYEQAQRSAARSGGHAAYHHASTEKTKNRCSRFSANRSANATGANEKRQGHGRNGASSYTGAKKVAVPHPVLHTGDHCPGCEKGRSLSAERTANAGEGLSVERRCAATVYELDRLRCNLCGEVFTAPEPDGVRTRKIRRNHGGDDRAAEVRQRHAVLPF